MDTQNHEIVIRLKRIEEMLLAALRGHVQKDFYTVDEFARLVEREPYTVREWCRLGRIKAEKRACGRGLAQEWIIPHAEFIRYTNHGLLPLEHRR